MPLRLLWQPRHARDVDVPFILEVIDYDTRWQSSTALERWEMLNPNKRWYALPAFARWVIMETRRFVWRRREDE